MTLPDPARVRGFTGAALAQIAFPLGGIGTGTVSLGGRGELRDWEIFNQPNKGAVLEKTFRALRVQSADGTTALRVVEREHLAPFIGALGYENQRGTGLPRFPEATFRGEYPFADIEFRDDAFPARVALEAYNPFVPMDVEASSIPGMILNYRVENTGAAAIDVSLLSVMQNPIAAPMRPVGWLGPGIADPAMTPAPEVPETVNQSRSEGGLTGLWFTAPGLAPGSAHLTTAAMTTSWPDVDIQTTLYRGPWWDDLQILWNEFSATGRLEPKLGPAFGEPLDPDREKSRWEAGALCLRARLAPGEAAVLPIFIHWHSPNARLWGGDNAVPVRTYVATQFRDAWDAARHTHQNLPRLEAATRAWRAAFFSSTLPPEVLDAASANLSTLRSQTMLRAADGNIYAWEGCGDTRGSCSGNCTHVWNYEQALAFLFPSLERTMRRIDFGPNMRSGGSMAFRCEAPAGGGSTAGFFMHPCVDGQMGNIVQAYRDWRVSGDEAFLRELWPNIRRALEYAWTRPGGWDPDKDGLMEGRQHNTYDIEFYGPNSMLGSLYLAALRAGEAMARHLGEADRAAEYRAIYDSGRALTETRLWNGEYFVQQVSVMDPRQVPAHLVSPGSDAAKPFPKYQYGAGCLSDQLIGQWQAHVSGLGEILDPAKVKSALAAVHRHNFRRRLGGTASVQRVFALQDEAGLLLCSWPNGERPALPFVYSDEVWTGIEYQVAAHLIYEGLVDEGLEIVGAVRARYDGVRRNPWDEIECGHHYARALASWSLIPALSGARYDAVEQSLTFAPKLAGPFRCIVAMGNAWGVVMLEEGRPTLAVIHGEVALRRFGLEGQAAVFETPRRLTAGDRLTS